MSANIPIWNVEFSIIWNRAIHFPCITYEHLCSNFPRGSTEHYVYHIGKPERQFPHMQSGILYAYDIYQILCTNFAT